jgi:copper homeostasis protein
MESCLEAQRGGADRVELCCALNTGGLTPSAALVASARELLQIPLFVLIRPREGDFMYSAREIRLMVDEIRRMTDLGADGLVCGALTESREADHGVMSQLVRAAGRLPVTFHRAFDLITNRAEAVDVLADSGCTRVLTSGGASAVGDGLEVIRDTIALAGNRLTVIAGGGLQATDVRPLYDSGVREFHLSGRMPVRSIHISHLYSMDYYRTSHVLVSDVVNALRQITAPDGH